VPQAIQALDARLHKDMTEEQLADLEYQFRVIFTLDNARKSNAHFAFVEPHSKEGGEIRNVLLKYKLADDLYPFKATQVARMVREKARKKFTTHNHVQAWKLYKARPRSGSRDSGNTNKDLHLSCCAQRLHLLAKMDRSPG
jgi:hypothetical protein